MDLAGRWPEDSVGRTRVRDRLLASYAAPTRGYHDVRHLAEVLDRLDELIPAGFTGRDAVLLAAWFHDAVYAAHDEQSDEELSARLAERELDGLDETLVAEVARLVRLTETHRPGPHDTAGQLLCDADLAILAAPAQRYAEYVAGVRADYADVPEADFRAGRRAVLESLLAAPTLFGSATARARWEAPARANLSAEVAELFLTRSPAATSRRTSPGC